MMGSAGGAAEGSREQLLEVGTAQQGMVPRLETGAVLGFASVRTPCQEGLPQC